jgi:2-dehydropantoate 2-reductase
LNAIACTTSASDRPIGFIKSDKWWRRKLEGCVVEVVNVSYAEGVEMDSGAVMAQIDCLPDGLTTSMQRDINAGNPSEIDAVAGAVVRVGKRHGISCPTIEEMIGIIQDRIETISNTS